MKRFVLTPRAKQDRRHFPERWKKTEVITARDVIELLIEQEK